MAEVDEGTVVDGRYRIKDRIGSGGMADVYRAEDSQLGRDVAIKMLHRRFARDLEFVERFRREASAAASLQHPNVVNVFDRGEHDGTYYIAMENLRGRTLKQVIRDEAPLGQLRAIDLATQILQAAGFAHRRGVIHRDFKPHNVIVGPDDRLKVTDFGIARAGASEMTETGSIMGTAQYLSPEQAQGQRVGAPSDLYSIGVIIFEMLTGRVPFDGDSAVAIALKHISEQAPPLRSLRPDVHPVLEAVVARALAKAPEQRFRDAGEFLAALEAARAAIAAGGNGQGTAMFAPLEPLPEPLARERRWPLVLLALLALALAGGALAWKLTHPAQQTVPFVVGERAGPARATLERAGFRVASHGLASKVRPGIVVDETPRGHTRADSGSTVNLAVSTGPLRTLVPAVAGMPQDQAVKTLSEQGFVPIVQARSSASVPTGIAIGTAPRDAQLVPKGSNVRLFISSGPALAHVPSVVGQPSGQATSTLQGAGFTVSTQTADSDQPKDQVIAEDPRGGTRATRGTTVTLTVSKGSPKVALPSVSGKSSADARSALEQAGFKVRSVDQPSNQPKGTVIRQDPGGGSQQPKGSVVAIVVSTGPSSGAGPGTGAAPAPPADGGQTPGQGAPAPKPPGT
ncbi:MAG: Stk1 family PASTA domain-containing Ser/Thr kinase [Thermoleophilaceae bacterium]